MLDFRDSLYSPERVMRRNHEVRRACPRQFEPYVNPGRLDALIEKAEGELMQARQRLAILKNLKHEREWRVALLVCGVPVVEEPGNAHANGAVPGGPYLWEGDEALIGRVVLARTTPALADEGLDMTRHPETLIGHFRPPGCPPPPALPPWGTSYGSSSSGSSTANYWDPLVKKYGAWNPRLIWPDPEATKPPGPKEWAAIGVSTPPPITRR